MGCANSKRAVSVAAASPVSEEIHGPLPPPSPPALTMIDRQFSAFSLKNPHGCVGIERKHRKDGRDWCKHHKGDGYSNDHNNGGEKNSDLENGKSQNCRRSRRGSFGRRSGSLSFKLGISRRNVEAEYVNAGWPSWLTAVAGEVIQGWVPLHADAYEKLEKIGQGTYSSVFRAREVKTGKMFALKKVRFDNLQAESIRFMAREIMILRRLDHPNIMSLEGIITSRMSSSIYLVFEYMEHDLAGLSSSPEIKLNESQVKCYMKQLLCGIEHCHLRGVIHRDIKAANILVNNKGILKIGDFGLANVLNSRNRQQLTSRVVTLWYRPPELLMGSTSYGVAVDLWSIGCVLAEIYLGKPLLKGRTEVEQLHKIFKLCGSPPDEYWSQSELPNATMFRPQQCYETSLRERCKDLPKTSVDLIETLLSIQPEKRGTASSGLMSQYFNTTPYACDPSTLPQYPPNKEMDAKYREARRTRTSCRLRESGASKKPKRVLRTLQQQNNFNRFTLKETKDTQHMHKNTNAQVNGAKSVHREPSSSLDKIDETFQVKESDHIFIGPELRASTGFAWAKMRSDDATSVLSYTQSISESQLSELDSSRFNFANNNSFSLQKEASTDSDATIEQKKQHNLSDPSNAPILCHSLDPTTGFPTHLRSGLTRGHSNQREKIEFSGPLSLQSSKIDQLNTIDAFLQRNEDKIRHAVRRSRVDIGTYETNYQSTKSYCKISFSS
ncbi:hypothetical protein K2173_019899 [Erythroxylum novogranatense]|uniref:Protein kinase domain-containing protein n=1 Tax=Erythroxylum novogranatense TaxID=1862640 RepID=A0AAV8U6J5_9ROSI|nr:hypothetical protein K2173_019899 [Erythroxylum novogranatense]